MSKLINIMECPTPGPYKYSPSVQNLRLCKHFSGNCDCLGKCPIKKCRPSHSLGIYAKDHKLLRFQGFYFIVPTSSLIKLDYFKASFNGGFKNQEVIHFDEILLS